MPLDDRDQLRRKMQNGPPKQSEKQKQIRQVPFRMHAHDYLALRRMLDRDNWKLQKMFEAVVDAYMKSDPLLMKILIDWKEENVVTRRQQRSYALSNREKGNILDEIGDIDGEHRR